MTSDKGPAGKNVPTTDHTTSTELFRRVLVPILDASQAGQAAELARGAGASEARVLHLNLHETINGRRFPIETDSAASYVVEAGVFELRMAGIAASGQVRHTLVGKAAAEIVADAIAWGADLIILGEPRRSGFASRLFGSVTSRVLKHAHCPVLVASPEATVRMSTVTEEQYAGARS
jgi:nucleotide-binding universal stress UspA family protein